MIVLFILLFVCLIFIIIGGLFFVIGIVGMDCVFWVNVIIKSGKVVEIVGDIDVLLFDKIGIIIIGNWKVMYFYFVFGVSEVDFVRVVVFSLFVDEMLEGKLIIEFLGINLLEIKIY